MIEDMVQSFLLQGLTLGLYYVFFRAFFSFVFDATIKQKDGVFYAVYQKIIQTR